MTWSTRTCKLITVCTRHRYVAGPLLVSLSYPRMPWKYLQIWCPLLRLQSPHSPDPYTPCNFLSSGDLRFQKTADIGKASRTWHIFNRASNFLRKLINQNGPNNVLLRHVHFFSWKLFFLSYPLAAKSCTFLAFSLKNFSLKSWQACVTYSMLNSEILSAWH